MNQEHPRQAATKPVTDTTGHAGHKNSHRWMMVACCIPMVIIVVALIAAGAINIGWLLFAAACVALMAMMMGGMHGESHK